MSIALTIDDLDNLVAGSQLGVLSAASPFPALRTWVQSLLESHGPLPLIRPGEVDATLPSHARAVAVGSVGSLPALLEMPFRGDEPATVIGEIERMTGESVAAVAPLNAAGPNALLAVAVASSLDLPLLNCDGQSRVLPLIDQTTYALAGIPVAPMAAVGPWGDVITISSPMDRTETLARAAATASGGWLISAFYSSPARDLAAAGIADAITRCIAVGSMLLDRSGNIGEILAHELGGHLLGHGRVIEIERHSESGMVSNQPAQPVSIVIEDSGQARRRIRFEVRNEVVMATIDGDVVATVPDIICLLDPLSRSSVDLFDLAVGDVAQALALPANPMWRTSAGVAMAGPRAFGLPLSWHGVGR